MSLINEYELKAWPNNKYVMGIDEAGRGPLCGPLVVASCVLPIDYQNESINDSKKLTAKKRELLFKEIINDAIYYSFRIVSPKEIDELNIYAATKKAMTELSNECDYLEYVLTDAMPIDNEKAIPIIKGDAKSISIAAASILAKVLRDYIMNGYHILYPEFEYNKHKGYPTKKHLELMDKYGITDIYRMSYKPCFDRKDKKYSK